MNPEPAVDPLDEARNVTVPRPGHQLLLLEGGEALFPALVEAMDAARRVASDKRPRPPTAATAR